METKTRRQCIVCQSENYVPLLVNGESFTTEQSVMCSVCGLVYLRQYNIDDEYYESGHFDQELRSGEFFDKDRSQRAYLRAQIFAEYLKHDMFVCDVGCGHGEVLDMVTNFVNCQNVTGFDPSPVAEFCKRKGHNVTIGPFDPEAVTMLDVIFIIHVIEHIENPIEWVQMLAQSLVNGGLLIVEYPDLLRALRRPVFRNNYFQKSHLFDFSFSHIEYIMSLAGLRCVAKKSWTQAGVDKNMLCVFEKSGIAVKPKNFFWNIVRDITFDGASKQGLLPL